MGIKKNIIIGRTVLVLLGLALITFCSGCVEKNIFAANLGSKVSAADEINTSASLINSAETRIMSVRQDVESSTYSNAKINLNASETDFEEALKILNNASSDYEEEIQDIETYKTLAEGGLDRVHSLESLITAMEHSDKSMAYAYSKEFNLSRKELNIANEALNESAASSISAKEKVFTIDPKSVPIEQKSSIILLRNDLEASETMHSELRQMMSGMYPYMDGYVCLSNGIEYGDAEEWGKAADEFGKASDKFSESQKILETLKDSEYSEVSVTAIEICGILTQAQKDLPHIEAGCRYMEKGRYYQANAEFNNVSYYY
ncbi:MULTISPECIES: hypothetical protein [Methanosarcina]|jgi:hypothetical protein|uniref:Uncharacterized protein n=2 Tax=Methanosarcina mazei TaxID=2209 RepID=A0A0E3RHE7_METMZ|nr:MULTISPECIES: hypothetical protein [Methanosarcina]AKB63844.1 hypothetical protein MSMAS_0648 [Methanosarcina mazei S-6]AKB67320.1 hypothetical protein MSMAL_0777 [Methanosarcina mazei LYC]MDY0247050.1 hypothetical protein [Methanosarcina mazei]WIM43928.1 hypothetical protein PSF70_03620 [Methanosarcina mazei]WIM47383.1 hypothetical protein PQQ20_03605 [Methanosarcina mazei]